MLFSPYKIYTSISFWLLFTAAALVFSFYMVGEWEQAMADSETRTGLYLRGYGSSGPNLEQSSRKITKSGDRITAEYAFRNFDNEELQVSFTVSSRQLDSYRQQYGYTQRDLDDLVAWQRKELDRTYRFAVTNRLTQKELDRMHDEIKDVYREKVRQMIRTRGFKYREKDVITPDIPGIVQRNVAHLRPLALEINDIAHAKRYDATDVVGTVLSLVQTGLAYENIPLRTGRRITGGFYPPLVAMTEGRGDCDSKTAVMASTLMSWDQVRLVGVGIPDHYLLGVLQNPAKGDAYVEFEGMNYVLMEPTGPAWLAPGTISDYTLKVLNAGDQVALESLKMN